MPDGAAPELPAAAAMIAALRERGAERFDPVWFRYIEALARRTPLHAGAARRILEAKLAGALGEYEARLEAARVQAGDIATDAAARFPEAADELDGLRQSGDFRRLRRFAAGLQGGAAPGPLATLVRLLAEHAPEPREPASPREAPSGAESPAELKSLAHFRHIWSKFSVDQILSHSLAQAPENAGPLNSHHLVLRSLKLMRDISPAYLSQFVSYVDTLLWLDQATGEAPPPKTAAPRAPAKKARARTRKSAP